MSSAQRLFLKTLFLASLLALFFLGGCADDDADDMVPPAITLDALDPTRFDSQKELSGTVDETAEINISVNTSAEVGEIVLQDGVWSCLISDLEPGSNWVTVSAQDDFNTRTLEFDLAYNIVQVNQVRTVTDSAGTTVYGQLAPGGTIEAVQLNGTDLTDSLVPDPTENPWSMTVSGLEEEANTLVIEAAESAPDGRTQQISLTITRDPDAAEFAITPLPQPPDLTADQITLSGTVEAGAEIAVEISPDATVGDTAYPSATTWEAVVSDLREGPGVFTITAAADDSSTASGSVRFSVETDPLVVSTTPDDGATGVETDTAVIAAFNQAVVGSTVNEDSFLLKDGGGQTVAGTVAYDADEKEAVFTPDEQLTPSTTYTAELTADIVDPVGNAIAGETWVFTTVAD